MTPHPDRLRAALDADGFALMHGSQAVLVDALDALGRPIHVEEVRDTPGSASLVRSRSGIPWHTDHHRAERIVWYCLAKADEGGETLLVDGLAALALLDEDERDALRRAELFEHSIFRGDPSTHPVLTDGPNGRLKLYFSLWLADGAAGAATRSAMDAFGRALDRVPHHRFLLGPGDILAIDNCRMLHARTTIAGTSTRHLRRYWLATT